MEILGIDIGGSGIKGTIVDTDTGEFLEERHRIPTSQPATVETISETVKAIVDHFNYKGPVGCGFPAVVQNGVTRTASNIDSSWININVNEVFSHVTGNSVYVYNDADSAGFGELNFGCVKGFSGLAVFLTIGTGIGSAIINQGQLIPNSELGHLYLDNGLKAEHFASDAVRKHKDLKRKEWGKRFNVVLHHIVSLFYPDLIVLGGGASKKFHKYADVLTIDTEVKPAELFNHAGIIGSALLAQHDFYKHNS